MLSTTVSTSDNSVALKSAVLIYGHSSNHDKDDGSFSTIHKVSISPQGRPTIMPGRLVTEADISGMLSELKNAQACKSSVRWLDSQMLAMGSDRMIWWTPASKRAMFFKESSMHKGTFTGNGVCPIPSLIWVSLFGKGLYVFALAENVRPELNTKLYQAPFFNVWSNGSVCVGNAVKPRDEAVNDPDAWESMFFGSHFTHPNFTEKDRLVAGKLPVTFWKKMVSKPTKAFPSKRLVALDVCVSDLLNSTYKNQNTN